MYALIGIGHVSNPHNENVVALFTEYDAAKNYIEKSNRIIGFLSKNLHCLACTKMLASKTASQPTPEPPKR